MLEWLHLRSVGPTRDTQLAFAPRTNLLTGDNGLGKTFILDTAWWTMTRSWVTAPILPATRGDAGAPAIGVRFGGASRSYERVFEFSAEKQLWPLDPGRPPNPGLVIYARVDGSFGVWDPQRTADASDTTRQNIPFLFSPRDVWNGLEHNGRIACRGLIDDVVTWQLRQDSSFAQFTEVLRALSPDSAELELAPEPGRTSLEDVRDVPMLRASYGDVPLTHASAGVKRVAQLAYLLVWAWQEHQRAAAIREGAVDRQIVLLVDEIEAHLHPRWQQRVLPALRTVVDALANETQVQLIVATHSPIVLSSVDPIFDPAADKLFTLELGDVGGPDAGHPVVIEQLWRPRSDSGSWLASDAFDEATGRPVQVDDAIRAFAEAEASNLKHESHAAYDRLVGLVAPDDADLIRLRALLRARGWFDSDHGSPQATG
jgi:AAA domain, putative AbiEii toxin, Type IV TA system